MHAPHANSLWHVPELRAYVAFLLKEAVATERAKIAGRLAPLKQELIETTWAPARAAWWGEDVYED